MKRIFSSRIAQMYSQVQFRSSECLCTYLNKPRRYAGSRAAHQTAGMEEKHDRVTIGLVPAAVDIAFERNVMRGVDKCLARHVAGGHTN